MRPTPGRSGEMMQTPSAQEPVLVGRADIVATHESAMAVHHWRSVWIPIQRVSDIASAGERKFLIAEGTDHPETIQATHQG